MSGHSHHGDHGHDEHEKLVRKTIYLEDEVIEALEELAEEFTKTTGRRYTLGAAVRVALADFFTRRGKIV